MIILGIDPGTRRVGYGLVSKDGNSLKLLDAGLLKVSSRTDVEALREIKIEIDRLIASFKPDAISVEKLFFSKNQKTAMQVAEARGVIVLAARESGLPILEFSPNEVKLGLTGFGHADKKAVLKMVRLILAAPELDVIDDASDAIALAIVAADRLKTARG